MNRDISNEDEVYRYITIYALGKEFSPLEAYDDADAYEDCSLYGHAPYFDRTAIDHCGIAEW